LLEATAALAAGYGRVLAWSHWHVWKSNCVCNYTQIGICVKKNNVCWYDESFSRRRFRSAAALTRLRSSKTGEAIVAPPAGMN